MLANLLKFNFYRYKKKRHTYCIYLFIFVSWMMPTVNMVIHFFTFHSNKKTETIFKYWVTVNGCWFNHGTAVEYYDWHTISSNMAFMIIPLLFNILCYGMIIYKLKTVRGRLTQRNLLVLQRAIIICIVFTLSWLPTLLFEIITDIKRDTITSTDKDTKQSLYRSILAFTANIILFTSCLLNPILYQCPPQCFSRILREYRHSSHEKHNGSHATIFIQHQLELDKRSRPASFTQESNQNKEVIELGVNATLN